MIPIEAIINLATRQKTYRIRSIFDRSRHRIMALFAVCAVLFLALIYWWKVSIDHQAMEMRLAMAQGQTQLARSVVTSQKTLLNAYADIESPWDEFGQAIQKKDQKWFDVGVAVAMKAFKSDAVWAFDPNGKQVLSAEAPKKKGLAALEFPSDLVRKVAASRRIKHFFVKTPHGIVECCGAAVTSTLDPTRQKKIFGVFVAGRRWDTGTARDLAFQTNSSVTIRSGTTLPNDASVVQPLKGADSAVVGYAQFEFDNQYFEDLVQAPGRMLFLTAAFFGCMIVVLGIALFFWVSRPVERITTALDREDAGYVADLNRGSSEFRTLARLVEHHFDQRDELRQLLAEVQDAERRAEAASEAKGRFLARMSHEIRTPMNGVSGIAELLLRSPLPPEAAEQVRIIHTSARSLITVINDVLDFSQIEAGHLHITIEPMDMRQVINGVVALLRPTIGERPVRLEATISPELPSLVQGDEIRIRQVLMNLVGNALKFTERGLVEVRCEWREPGWVTISVIDAGIGIEPGRQELIFESFIQADDNTGKRFGGTGLGLAIARDLARLMKGDLTVHSQVGIGSTFALSIPAEAVEAPIESTEEAAPVVRSLRILVAEDHPTNQMVVRRLLTMEGHTVEVVENGDLAVSAAMAGSFDLVLMDVHMPVMDGIEATRELRAKGCVTPIVALTANAQDEFVDEYRSIGMDGFVAKPIDPAKLFGMINDIAA